MRAAIPALQALASGAAPPASSRMGGEAVAAAGTHLAMPTLIRLVVFLAFAAAIGFAAIFALATFVTPRERTISIDVPVETLVH